MIRILLLLLFLLYSPQTQAECKKFAHDLNGKLMSVRCGSSNPEFACPPLRAWDGRNCVKIPIVERCRKFGGEWINAQFIYNKTQSVFLDICKCPNGQTWNGISCTTVKPAHICKSYDTGCTPVHIRLLQPQKHKQPIISCEQFPKCSKKGE